ncbi:MAG: interleukin-like EMT inducer domain-containing protein [Cyanobacteriota bacterium]|nr:interleukin-like EMT inducer domain-containing protein [Cyanobacteriota bacterium]
MTTKEITLTATSGGYIGGNKAQFSLNGTEIGSGNDSRGMNAAVFDPATGRVLFSTHFDIALGNSHLLANFIDTLPEGTLVAIAVKGDGGGLTDSARSALKSLGSTLIDQLQPYQSYALIGFKQRPGQPACESLDWLETRASYTFEAEIHPTEDLLEIEVFSQPSTVEANYSVGGGKAAIQLNGNLLTPEGGYGSGWNVIVFDRADGQVKRSGCYTPWNPAEVEELVQLLQDLEAEEIVAIATQDYTGVNVDERVKAACASMGSTAISRLVYGGSWAMVGYRGATPGQAVENLDSINPYLPLFGYSSFRGEGVRIKYWSENGVPLNKDLRPEQKLEVNGASSYFAYDDAVSIEDDCALIGDRARGNVYVYRRHNGRWQSQQQLKPQGQSGSYFGYSVALGGDWAMVGQHYAKASRQEKAGAAHLYRLKDGQWQHSQMLQPSDLKGNDSFGKSVAVEGEMAIAGAPGVSVGGKANCGAAYVFQLENDQWVQRAKLQPEELGEGDRFGYRVSLHGNIVLVGAWGSNEAGQPECGAAYIFHLENGQWRQQKLQPPDLGGGERFGSSVAVAENWAIVGADGTDSPGQEECGAAYVFQWQDETWQFFGKLQASDGQESDRFGASVGIAGDVVVVGACAADAGGKMNCGAVYLFQRVDGQWEQQQKLQPAELPARGWWGYSAAFDGKRAILGGYGYDLNVPKAGFAYICSIASSKAVPAITPRFSAV